MKNIKSKVLKDKIMAQPTIKFLTLGCKVNQYDTQLMREACLSYNLKEVNSRHKADYYVINTCTVTSRSDSESLNLLRRVMRENPWAKVLVTGCLVKMDSQRIRQVKKDVILVENSRKPKLAEILFKERLRPQVKDLANQGISYFAGHTRAFLKVQDGCNYACSYCKVPLVRGSLQSRPLEAVLSEAKRLIANGYKEIVLTGICLGSYGRDFRPKKSLLELIHALLELDGLKRLRLSSIEPQDVSDELIQLMADCPKLCPHLHIPLQSADPKILKMMRRRYTAQEYLNLILRLKRKIPGLAITTDCLVGFPGETKENFFHTVKMIKRIQPLKTHIFPYSPRPGTYAFKNFKNLIPAKELKERVSFLSSVAQQASFNYRKKFLGAKKVVLFEEEINGVWFGFTDNYIKVRLKAKRDLKGKLARVLLTAIEGEQMAGRLI